MGPLELTVETRATMTIVTINMRHLSGDEEYAGILKEKFDAILEAEPTYLLIDLQTVELLSPMYLGIFISIFKKIGDRMRLIVCKPDLHTILEITNLNRHFSIYNTREDAEKIAA